MNSTCYRRRYQFCMGKSGYVDQIPTMKLFLKIIIAHSDALWRCIPSGASWKSMSLDLSPLWKAG